MTLHSLKIEQQYLDNLLVGKKKAEIRLNDRDYQVGDVLEFIDYSCLIEFKKVRFKIEHIHSGIGMEKNYVCLSVKYTEDEPIN